MLKMRGLYIVISAFMATTIISVVHADQMDASMNEVDQSWNQTDQIIFRSYKINDALADLLTAFNADSGSDAVSVKDFFSEVDFPEGTSAIFMPEFNSLFVEQSVAMINRMETALKSYQQEQQKLESKQVEIEVKLIEVSQNTLDELGFNWTFLEHNGGGLQVVDDLFFNNTPSGTAFNNVNPATTGGQSLFGSGLRSAATALQAGSAGSLAISKVTGDLQWNLVINALEQANESEVLSAPRVVTLDGSTAVIQVGEERMVPKSFEVNNQDTSPFVEHSDWDLELMGVYMEVTPELREDGLIDLELHPRILDIVGFDRYQVVSGYTYEEIIVSNGGVGWDGAADTFTINSINVGLPYLRIRELETRVTVADGNTIGMGGLIYDKSQSFNDSVPLLGKIPFIGRLFRSEGSRSIKRNLMIFVKASTVDLDGETPADMAMN
jgi:general secretion pathway protein D